MQEGMIKFKNPWEREEILVVLIALFLLILLQLWRPYYFLTDDNLTQYLPFLHEVGTNLRQGHPVFISQYLFEGGYDFSTDPSFLCAMHPGLLGLAVLTVGSPLFSGVLDFFCSLQILLAAVGFFKLTQLLRERGERILNTRQATFLSISYAFCVYNLWLGSSWFNWLGASVLPPWLLWAAWHPDRRTGLVVLILVTLHAILSTHVQGIFYAYFFCTILLGLRRHPEALQRLWIGGLVSSLVVFPLLWNCTMSYWDSPRHGVASTAEMLQGRLTPPEVIFSFLTGALRFWLGQQTWWFATHSAHAFSIAFAAGGPLLWMTLTWKKNPLTPLTSSVLGVLALGLLLVWRPPFLQSLIGHIPIINGFSSPFREVIPVIFFAHLWIFLRFPAPLKMPFWILATMGSIWFGLSLLPYGPPSIAERNLDRKAWRDGTAARFWANQKALHPDAIFIPVASDSDLIPDDAVPYSFLGTHCFPCLYEFRSVSGYSRTRSRGLNVEGSNEKPGLWNGLIRPGDALELVQSDSRYVIIDPETVRLWLEKDSRRTTR
jgi:hypothetical protein